MPVCLSAIHRLAIRRGGKIRVHKDSAQQRYIVQFVYADQPVDIGLVVHRDKRHRGEIGFQKRNAGPTWPEYAPVPGIEYAPSPGTGLLANFAPIVTGEGRKQELILFFVG